MSTLTPAPTTAALPAPPAEPPPAFAPTARRERLVNLDFARGVALLGILLVNVSVMFGPVAAMDPAYHHRLSDADRTAALLVRTFCQSKFISIFSLLFGYGLFGQIEKAAASGRSPAGFTFRRLGVLALFGLAHGLLIWFGDVLFLYATIGAWLLLARRAKTRTLIVVGICLLAFAVLMIAGLGMLGLLGDRVADAPSRPIPAPAGAPASVQAMYRAGFNPTSPVWIEAETTAYGSGPWIDAQVFRTAEWLGAIVFSLLMAGWLALGMFFLGAALNRLRFFAPEQRGLRWRVFRVCLPLGLAFEAAAAWFFWAYPLSNVRMELLGQVIQQVGLFFLPLGYLSGLALLADRLPDRLRGPVASAGRMSLTVYLTESLVATALAYHWGLGWFGKVAPLQQVGLAFVIWASLVACSHLWQSYVGTGPMEWLWRRLEYGRAASTSQPPPLSPQ
jgi:uncharacterized protein